MELNKKIEGLALSEYEFSIVDCFSDLKKVPSPLRLQYGYICVCLQGKAEVRLNMNDQVLIKHKLLILFPNEIITFSNITDDFSFLYIRMSPEFMGEILFRFPPSFIGFIKERFYHQMPEKAFDSFFNEFFKILQLRYDDTEHLCRREIIMNILRTFFLDIYSKIKINESLSQYNRSRKTQLMEQFCELVIKNFNRSREVSFYADKLFITPKYLSIILKEMDMHNRSAKEWIDDHTVTEIKLMLKTTNLSILEIANSMNFPSLSFFCKYFKCRAGITPKEYRKSMK